MKTKKQYIHKRTIFSKLKADEKWRYPRAVTATRLARTIDERGCTAMHFAAAKGYYPRGTKIDHLILAEQFMKPRSEQRARDFRSHSWFEFDSAFANSTPLEIAIRTAQFTRDMTQAKLEKARTIYGTGWDMVVQILRNRTKLRRSQPPYDGTYRLRVACAAETISKFPVLLALLNPLKHTFDEDLLTFWPLAVLLNEQTMSTLPSGKNYSLIAVYSLQTDPGFALKNLTKLVPEADRTQLLKACLLSRLPEVPGIGRKNVIENQLKNAPAFADWVCRCPEIASILDHKIKLHAEIIARLAASHYATPESRQILARHPKICAAIL